MTWSVFTRFSRTREIAESGVKRALLEDGQLRGWTQGNIFYGTAIPDINGNLIVVMLSTETDEAQPSVGELEVTARVVVVFAFDEIRDIIEDGDHDFSSVLLRVDSVLWSNPTLLFDGRDLALRLDRAEDFTYEQINSAEADGELASTLYPAREYSYIYRRDAATGAPT